MIEFYIFLHHTVSSFFFEKNNISVRLSPMDSCGSAPKANAEVSIARNASALDQEGNK